MKTSLYIVAILLFSALMLSPIPPAKYPPKEVLEQRREIIAKEKKIDRLIQKIEYTLAIDSLVIKQSK